MPTLQHRIAMRDREYERSIAPEYLERLNTLYEAWTASFTLCPLLVVPADRLDFVQDGGRGADRHQDRGRSCAATSWCCSSWFEELDRRTDVLLHNQTVARLRRQRQPWRSIALKRIIETLSAGFEVIARRPWIILLPILLDLFYWLGPQISLQPLVERGLEDAEAWRSRTTRLGRGLGAVARDGRGAPLARLCQLNLFTVVSSLQRALLSLHGAPGSAQPDRQQRPVGRRAGGVRGDQIASGWPLLGARSSLVLVGLLVAVIYHGLIAQQSRRADQPALPRPPIGPLLAACDHLACAIALVLAMIAGPLVIVLLIAGALSPFLVQMLTLLGSTLAFGSPFISCSSRTASCWARSRRCAWWTSMNIVHKNFWVVLILLILIRLIRTGLGLVWPIFTGSIPGMLFAIVANAFVSAGLAAAGLVFFRDCYADWREHLAQALLAQKQAQVDKES